LTIGIILAETDMAHHPSEVGETGAGSPSFTPRACIVAQADRRAFMD
jgi:hypothetical protein